MGHFITDGHPRSCHWGHRSGLTIPPRRRGWLPCPLSLVILGLPAGQGQASPSRVQPQAGAFQSCLQRAPVARLPGLPLPALGEGYYPGHERGACNCLMGAERRGTGTGPLAAQPGPPMQDSEHRFCPPCSLSPSGYALLASHPTPCAHTFISFSDSKTFGST